MRHALDLEWRRSGGGGRGAGSAGLTVEGRPDAEGDTSASMNDDVRMDDVADVADVAATSVDDEEGDDDDQFVVPPGWELPGTAPRRSRRAGETLMELKEDDDEEGAAAEEAHEGTEAKAGGLEEGEDVEGDRLWR